jgi:hypothetical protein
MRYFLATCYPERVHPRNAVDLRVSHNAASPDYLITATYIYTYFSTKQLVQALGEERVCEELREIKSQRW